MDIDADLAEYTDLSRQGLLVDTSPPRRLPEGIALPADVTGETTKGN
jgi:hypothetical protein